MYAKISLRTAGALQTIAYNQGHNQQIAPLDVARGIKGLVTVEIAQILTPLPLQGKDYPFQINFVSNRFVGPVVIYKHLSNKDSEWL